MNKKDRVDFIRNELKKTGEYSDEEVGKLIEKYGAREIYLSVSKVLIIGDKRDCKRWILNDLERKKKKELKKK